MKKALECFRQEDPAVLIHLGGVLVLLCKILLPLHQGSCRYKPRLSINDSIKTHRQQFETFGLS